jgi:hypothetical protein
MEKPILTDKDQFPTEELIFSHLGKNKALWCTFFDYIHSNYPDLAEEWRYYNDGKSWLMKVTKKTKTIFWLSLFENTFRITFYFTDRAEQTIMDSKISDKLKQNFLEGKHYNKIRGLTIIFKFKKDIEDAKLLLPIKLNTK